MKQSISMLLSILLGTLLVALLLATLAYFNLQTLVTQLFDWLQNIGLWGVLIFMGIYILLVIFLLPTVIFTLGAGFLFGPLIGVATVVSASTLGAIFAFLTSKYLFSDKVKRYLRNHKKLNVVNDEFIYEGWKLILLTRLVPFFPLKLSNYFFGSTNFSLTDFLTGTFLGIIPNTFVIVYIGSLAADLSVLASGELLRSQNLWGFYVAALVLTLITVIYITKHAQKALARYELRSIERTRRKHAF
ncbi:MAG: putative membrane protein YdjX (TVP38/TMEM64 family) [Paraglaciecola sp.]|jgi:uncharacterized membrane protein YdjX (TVP38/TMEM64 family)